MYQFKERKSNTCTLTDEEVFFNETISTLQSIQFHLLKLELSVEQMEQISSLFFKYSHKEDYLNEMKQTLLDFEVPSFQLKQCMSDIKWEVRRNFRWGFDAFERYNLQWNDVVEAS